MADSTKQCPKCGETKSVDEFFKNRARSDGLSGYCRTCQQVVNRANLLRVRAEVMDLLGGPRCIGIDENGCPWQVADLRVLTIDHLDGGGRRHREEAGSEYSVLQYAKLHPKEFRVLCFNCNHLARLFLGHSGKAYAALIAASEGREKVTKPSRWARDFDACIECGTTDRPHKGGGRCDTCHQREWKRVRALTV